jgi:hypothetical protein
MALTVPPAFATVADLTVRLQRTFTPAQEEQAEALLEDASQKILDADKHDVLADLTEPTNTLKRIVCAMVGRAMPETTPGGGPPVVQQQWGAGPWNASATFATPSGDLYLTKAEKIDLGFLRQRAGAVDMWAGAYEETV